MSRLKNILNPKRLKPYLSKGFVLLIAVLFFLIKLLGDTLFYFFGDVYSPEASTFKILTSAVILIGFILYFYVKSYEGIETLEKTSTKIYFKELRNILLFTIVILLFSYLIPESLRDYGPFPNYVSMLIVEIINFFSLFAGLYLITFIIKWLWIRRHKRTKVFLNIIVYVFFAIILFELPFHYYRPTVEELSGETILLFISAILILTIMFIIFFAAKRNKWIAVLPRNQKFKLLTFYFLGIFLSIYFLTLSIEEGGEGAFTVASQFFFGCDTILFLAYYSALPYFIRLMFSTISTLPTTDILEQTTSEISSLTYLNRLITKTIDMDELIDALTDLALYTCNGIAAWTEIYNEDGSITIGSSKYVSEEQINSLDDNGDLREFLSEINKPLLAQSLYEYPKLAALNWSYMPEAKSLIITPLYSGENRVGTLIVLHPEDYGLEDDDLKIMEAFGDNAKVALENAELVKDSIEKERYKRELFLAREMQEKLLPKRLPDIEGFSLAAFSIPALEVGGDYYDIVKLKDGKTCILIGDVSGKGLSAAFVMAQLKGVVSALAPLSNSCSEMLKNINYSLYGKIDRKTFITLSALKIDEETRKLSFARAGHTPLIYKNENSIEEITPKGIGVGLAQNKIFNANIEETKIKIEPKDVCLMFTDGISELRNDEKIEFGYDSLKQILNNAVYNNKASNLIEIIRKEIDDYADGKSPKDDMTAVVLLGK